MHMGDALISPLVGGTMIAASGGVLSYSTKIIEKEILEKRIPLMGVVGAFIFAAQMINFSIPGTGSSGHIGGGILLAILLGPSAGFMTMACVLLVQALFFADGGLLAIGCNLINLGFFTCYVAYPLIYKPIISRGYSKRNIFIGAILAGIVGLQLGSLGVVLETFFSGRTELTLSTFLMFMQPIHLAIGFIEGLITAAIVSYIYEYRKETIYSIYIQDNDDSLVRREKGNKSIIILFVTSALVIGGALSLFASDNPDGLEWAIDKVTMSKGIENDSNLVQNIESIQENTAILPDYNYDGNNEDILPDNSGTSVSGIVGSLFTLVAAASIGLIVRKINNKKSIGNEQW